MAELTGFLAGLAGLSPGVGWFLFLLLVFCEWYIFVEMAMWRRYPFRSVLSSYNNSYFDRIIHYVVFGILSNIAYFYIVYFAKALNALAEVFNSTWPVAKILEHFTGNISETQLVIFWISYFFMMFITFTLPIRIVMYIDVIMNTLLNFFCNLFWWMGIIFAWATAKNSKEKIRHSLMRNNARLIKCAITVSALSAVVIHYFFPSIQIEYTTIILIAISAMPWFTSFFKWIELPGGFKIDFQDFDKITKEVEVAGLTVNKSAMKNIKARKYGFLEYAQIDIGVSLMVLRMELERNLRSLGVTAWIDVARKSTRQIVNALKDTRKLTVEEEDLIMDMIWTLNHAVHGIEFDERIAKWIIDVAPKILYSMELKAAK